MRKIHFYAFAVISTFGASPAFATATVYDLKTGFSTAANPNGTWTYLQGGAALPFDADWTQISNADAAYNPASGHIPQPSWAPSNTPGQFLPVIFRARVTPKTAGFDWKKGDVVMHTTDAFNGTGPANGIGSVLWTSPAHGIGTISGVLWNARSLGRDQKWSLVVNGTQRASGDLPGNGTITRLLPTKFKVPHVAMNAGDMVQLIAFHGGDQTVPGDFIGMDLKVSFTPN